MKMHDHQQVEAPRISLKEAGQLAMDGKVLLVDVRTLEEYRLSHAPGAVNLPLQELPSRLGTLPQEKRILTYCT